MLATHIDSLAPWKLCPPPGSTGSAGSGTGHRQQPATSEPPKKPAPTRQ